MRNNPRLLQILLFAAGAGCDARHRSLGSGHLEQTECGRVPEDVPRVKAYPWVFARAMNCKARIESAPCLKKVVGGLQRRIAQQIAPGLEQHLSGPGCRCCNVLCGVWHSCFISSGREFFLSILPLGVWGRDD